MFVLCCDGLYYMTLNDEDDLVCTINPNHPMIRCFFKRSDAEDCRSRIIALADFKIVEIE